MTKRRSSVGLWAMAWLLCALLAPAFTDPDAVGARVHAERAAARHLLGAVARWWPADRADGDGTPSSLVAVSSGLTGARAALQRVDRYATAFLRQWQGARVRLTALGLWLLVLAPLVTATVVDGLAARAIRSASFGFQSPAAHALARRLLAALGLLPLFALVWPAPLPAAWAAACCAAVLVPLRVALVHLPPVFAR